MKSVLITLASSFLTFGSSFAGNIVKTCNTIISIPNEGEVEKFNVLISFESENDLMFANVNYLDFDQVDKMFSQVYLDQPVRAGDWDVQSSDNVAEAIISVSKEMIELTNTPNNIAGFNLSEVRSANVYTIGNFNESYSAIVEAKDQNGAVLGSFIGGVAGLSPCK